MNLEKIPMGLGGWRKKESMAQRWGGLGIKNLQIFNAALLEKRQRRIVNEYNSLWCQVLKSKYGISGSLVDEIKDLGKTCENGIQERWFDKNISWKVDDHMKVKFWCENWVGDGTLYLKNTTDYIVVWGKAEGGWKEFRHGIYVEGRNGYEINKVHVFILSTLHTQCNHQMNKLLFRSTSPFGGILGPIKCSNFCMESAT
ncbi:hypothetical protein CR513_06757, partial [Mucuna pruriens]